MFFITFLKLVTSCNITHSFSMADFKTYLDLKQENYVATGMQNIFTAVEFGGLQADGSVVVTRCDMTKNHLIVSITTRNNNFCEWVLINREVLCYNNLLQYGVDRNTNIHQDFRSWDREVWVGAREDDQSTCIYSLYIIFCSWGAHESRKQP